MSRMLNWLFWLKLSKRKRRLCFRRSPRGPVDRSPVGCLGSFLSTDVFVSQPNSLPWCDFFNEAIAESRIVFLNLCDNSVKMLRLISAMERRRGVAAATA